MRNKCSFYINLKYALLFNIKMKESHMKIIWLDIEIILLLNASRYAERI